MTNNNRFEVKHHPSSASDKEEGESVFLCVCLATCDIFNCLFIKYLVRILEYSVKKAFIQISVRVYLTSYMSIWVQYSLVMSVGGHKSPYM